MKSDTILPYAPIPESSYYSANPNWQFNIFEHKNFIKLTTSSHVTGSTFTHETGHHFGLFHTFQMSSTPYQNPPLNNANDFPYPVLGPNNQIIPTWWGRELVTRINTTNEDHNEVNFGVAGDLIGDTPADCNWQAPSIFPGCPLTAQNIGGCDFNSTLTYVDYNEDPISPPPAGLSLGRNFMSYWRESCLNQFTPLQLDRARFYFETERQPVYTPDRCGNFTDKVELEGTGIGLHNVTIRVRHAGATQKCNVTSNLQGNFSGLIHQDNMQVNIYQNGRRNLLNFPNDPLKIHYDHTRCEWKRGVTVDDLFLIKRHILGIPPLLNGYQIIAADASKSNTVTTFDEVELRKLIMGTYDDFLPNHEQPFRYIPEFVPQNFAAAFNLNPFAVLGGAYLEQSWQYAIPNAGQRGFDGIKIGDLNSSWKTDTICPFEAGEPGGGGATLAVPTSGLAENDMVVLTVKLQNAQQLSGFQFGLKIPFAQFEIQDVITNTLPGFTKADNFGHNLVDQDAFTTLWVDPNAGSQTLPAESPIFRIIVKAKQSIPNLQSLISLNSENLPAIFLQSGGAVTSSPVALTLEASPPVGNRTTENSLNAVSQDELRCDPNPMQNALRVGFTNAGLTTEGVLSLTDIAGILVHQQAITLQSGENNILLDNLEKIPKGVYMVSLRVNERIFSTKVIKN